MNDKQPTEALEFLVAGYANEPERVAQAYLQFLKDKQEELESKHSWLLFLEEVQRGTQVNIYAFK